MGRDTETLIVPHLGEFDQRALFSKRLDYEEPVFRWLSDNVPGKYDLVVEIGANVGVYTVFLDALARSGSAVQLLRIIAFEPSPGAYKRLLENLEANNATHVMTFQAAVGTVSGVQSFFEPEGHLTNGSLLRDFSVMFSNVLFERPVIVLKASELEKFFQNSKKCLLKIDVEGFEPELIAGLTFVIRKYRPDLLVEVLDITADLLNISEPLSDYHKSMITDQGPREYPSIFASSKFRDWILTSPLEISP